ncbi:MAG: phosphodiester glycosidase family protein [Eubacteriales bacterium]|nr:phosphodiester glycosidase family protein [Eubacteriales bacterium]
MIKNRLFLLVSLLMIAALAFLLPSSAALTEGFIPIPWEEKIAPIPDYSKYSNEDLSYKDDSLTIDGYRGREYDTNYIYMHIKLSDPSQLRTAPASSFRSQSTAVGSKIAKRVQAVMAINGDFFTMDPYGVAIRNGHVYRTRPTGEDILFIDNLGDFHVLEGIRKAEPVKQFIKDAEANGKPIIHAFTFGPVLVKNGESIIPVGQKFNYFNTASQKLAQRISFSQLGPLEYLVVATDGPENKNCKGLKMEEIAALTAKIGKIFSPDGCIISYNLDGGSSSTVVMNNQKVNAPGSKIRYIADIIFFATLVR